MTPKQILWAVILVLVAVIICLIVGFGAYIYLNQRGQTNQGGPTSTTLVLTANALSLRQTAAAGQPAPVEETQQVPEVTQEGSQPTITEPLSDVPTISADENTNCRLGPSQLYDIVGYLLTNQESIVAGRNSESNWWYIENPAKPGAFCWVWGGTTSVQGETSALKVVEPPPPPENPEIAFGAAFTRVLLCDGSSAAMIQVINTGQTPFESVRVNIQNLDTDVANTGTLFPNTPFTQSASVCPPGETTLLPGEGAYIGSAFSGMSPVTNTYKATITLCTEDNNLGECVVQVLEFDHP